MVGMVSLGCNGLWIGKEHTMKTQVISKREWFCFHTLNDGTGIRIVLPYPGTVPVVVTCTVADRNRASRASTPKFIMAVLLCHFGVGGGWGESALLSKYLLWNYDNCFALYPFETTTLLLFTCMLWDYESVDVKKLFNINIFTLRFMQDRETRKLTPLIMCRHKIVTHGLPSSPARLNCWRSVFSLAMLHRLRLNIRTITTARMITTTATATTMATIDPVPSFLLLSVWDPVCEPSVCRTKRM